MGKVPECGQRWAVIPQIPDTSLLGLSETKTLFRLNRAMRTVSWASPEAKDISADH